MDFTKQANELFDRLYGQPREDLDSRELKVIVEWLSELLQAERNAGRDEGNDAMYERAFAAGYRRGLQEAAEIAEEYDLKTNPQILELAERIRSLDVSSKKT